MTLKDALMRVFFLLCICRSTAEGGFFMKLLYAEDEPAMAEAVTDIL